MQMKLSEIIAPDEDLLAVLLDAEAYRELEDSTFKRRFIPCQWGGKYEGCSILVFRPLERLTSACRWQTHGFVNDQTNGQMCSAYLLIDRVPDFPQDVASQFLFDRRFN